MIIVIFLISSICSYLVVYGLRDYLLRKKVMDVPSERSSHLVPTPRGGGISFVFVWIVATILGSETNMWPYSVPPMMLLGAFAISFIGLLDDFKGLRVLLRFTAHLLIAVVFVFSLGGMPTVNIGSMDISLGPIGFLIAVLGVTWSINLYNFMDGIDLIGSVEAITIFSVGGAMLLLSGAKTEGMVAILLVFTVIGFVFWNIPPAKIFMGDVGSGFLGFMVAAFALIGERRYGIPILLWVILYGTFWFDATVTLLRRIIRMENWTQPHHSHAYQRIYQAGWSHTQVSIAICGINAFLATLTMLGYFYNQLVPFIFLFVFLTLTIFYTLIERKRPMV